MLHRKMIGSRAFFARKTIARKQQAGRLEAELLMLSLADKAVCRASKARNVASVKMIPHGIESYAFEKEFMLNTAPSSSLKADSDDDMTTEIDTDPLKSTLRQSRRPLRWVEEQTIQKSEFKASMNRASLNQLDPQQPSFTSIAGRNSLSRSIDKSPILWTIPLESDEPDIVSHSTEKSDQEHVHPVPTSDFSNTIKIESRSLVIDVPDLNSESSPASEEVSHFNLYKFLFEPYIKIYCLCASMIFLFF